MQVVAVAVREDGVGLCEENQIYKKIHGSNEGISCSDQRMEAQEGGTIWRSSPTKIVARMDMTSSLLVITSTRPCGGQTVIRALTG